MYVGTLAWFSTLGRKERSSSMIYVFRKKDSAWEIKTDKSKSLFDMQFINVEHQYDIGVIAVGTGRVLVLTAHNMSVYVRENIVSPFSSVMT